ncbi:MAG: hypothetical protein OEY24_06685 [Candidatus Bathyarchaeota archaeon]|nr:hypothetical protein [Candidatus Bathyarchaeota archaeon]MDH5495370.1 hypothetical protein [Candidatus Bathyarchaeota archaeon]
MAADLTALVIGVVINTIVISPVLWLSGRGLVGKEKAKLADAVWIVIIGTVVGALLGVFITGLVGAVVQLVIWLALVKHFFDCGWLKALAISIFAVIIFIIVMLILAFVGIVIWVLWF